MFLNPKDENDRLPRNVCNKLPPLEEYHRKAQLSVPLNVFPCSRTKPLPSKRHCLCSVTEKIILLGLNNGQHGRSGVRFPILSLGFSLKYTFRYSMALVVVSASKRNGYQEYLMG